MASNAEVNAKLDEMRASITRISDAGVTQAEKLTELAIDVQKLIDGGTLDPATIDKLNAIATDLGTIADAETTQAQTLSDLAGKS